MAIYGMPYTCVGILSNAANQSANLIEALAPAIIGGFVVGKYMIKKQKNLISIFKKFNQKLDKDALDDIVIENNHKRDNIEIFSKDLNDNFEIANLIDEISDLRIKLESMKQRLNTYQLSNPKKAPINIAKKLEHEEEQI